MELSAKNQGQLTKPSFEKSLKRKNEKKSAFANNYDHLRLKYVLTAS